MKFPFPLIKYSTFPEYVPITFVIKDLRNYEITRKNFIIFHIIFPDDKKQKDYCILFPLYEFATKYNKYPRKKRIIAGEKDLLITIQKEYFGKIKILDLQPFIKTKKPKKLLL